MKKMTFKAMEKAATMREPDGADMLFSNGTWILGLHEMVLPKDYPALPGEKGAGKTRWNKATRHIDLAGHLSRWKCEHKVDPVHFMGARVDLVVDEDGAFTPIMAEGETFLVDHLWWTVVEELELEVYLTSAQGARIAVGVGEKGEEPTTICSARTGKRDHRFTNDSVDLVGVLTEARLELGKVWHAGAPILHRVDQALAALK